MMSNEAAPVVHIEKLIAATPAEVYRAWLEPDLLRRWLAPGALVVSGVEVEARVGGHFHVQQSMSGRIGGGFDCEIIELVPDQRIVFHWGFVGPERRSGPAFDSLLTVSFAAAGAQTLLTLRHERLDTLHQAMPQVADKVQLGWQLVFEKLAELLEEH